MMIDTYSVLAKRFHLLYDFSAQIERYSSYRSEITVHMQLYYCAKAYSTLKTII